MSAELLEFPEPTITKDAGKQVKTWSCACGRQLGLFSAWRSWNLHGKIICGECAQVESEKYQEWVREQEIIKGTQEA